MLKQDLWRFERATRDDCTRSPEPIQGPYEASYRLADGVIAAILVGVIAAVMFGGFV